MQEPPIGDVTTLLQQIRAGDSQAADKLIPLVVDELRRLARLQLRDERPGHTLQPTALVNEAYMRLVGDQARDWQNRAHFIGVSVSVMKRILIDHARRKQALKRGSEVQSICLERKIMPASPWSRPKNSWRSTLLSTGWRR